MGLPFIVGTILYILLLVLITIWLKKFHLCKKHLLNGDSYKQSVEIVDDSVIAKFNLSNGKNQQE